ncbi:M2 family metallopeptidase [Sphingomicrobium sediminis]|uniref:M2 family metallopeptidase n=1 Tax=Sphingomicrobium sediminis TaxID=2950949 RepID=A0A9X2EFC0_9SPHN|nr:M2 family metallopeptidase [Sphingomicrobium sediminis]MCM8556893.1 M2 family metallopeptidase [Sphingomicrobium sediminis]
MIKYTATVSLAALTLAGCMTYNEQTYNNPPVATEAQAEDGLEFPLTPAGAKAFVEDAERQYAEFSPIAAQAAWVNSTYINRDTDALASYFGTIGTEMTTEFANDAAIYAQVEGLDAETERKLVMLRTGITMPAPTTEGAAAELNEVATRLNSAYGKGQAELNGEMIPGNDAEALMGTIRDPEELQQLWVSWHNNVGRPMKEDYERFVEITNAGAQELGFADTGALWRSNYDMTPQEFSAMYDRLWAEVEPLYADLHCYVRSELSDYYGADVQPDEGMIRADLLGNMWAQGWGNVYDIVAPEGAGDLGYDLTDLLVENDVDAVEIARISERFFTSLGLDPLPETFWERSQIVRPEGREVVCHASAWNLDNVDDLRIKMCTKVNADDFVTMHHELGHNYYQRAYNDKDFLYLNGANDGFHEAIGDFVALSVTPDYLVTLGLLDESRVPSADKDIGLLLNQAMDKVAFLPFGLLVDKWRWGVFDGSITPAEYTDAWVGLKEQYQGVTPPVSRDNPANFDPGAKYHIPGNTPYARYFLAHILQFQFYEAACEIAEWDGPLHRCSFYGNENVGARLNALLEMGASKPWPDALEAFTGTREMSAEPMKEYFAPLQAWLKEQNAGKNCGWDA